AALAEAVAGPIHIAGLVRGLHRRDHAELREARDVVGVEDLRVLDAEAVDGGGVLVERGLVRIEHEAVAAVADGVRVHLEAGGQRAAGDVLDVRGRRDEQAAGAGVVGVRLEQRRTARAQRAVLVELDAAYPERAVVRADQRTATEPGL